MKNIIGLRGICVVIALAALTLGSSAASIGRIGVALTPRHFPKHSADDVQNMFEVASQLGDVGVFIYQWSQPDLHAVAARMVDLSQKHKLTPVLALSPTVLSGSRGAFDVPAEIRRGGKPSFADKPVYERFIHDAAELAKLKPPYLCLGTEINLLAHADLQQFLTFAHVYKRLYPELKKISPNTKIFVSMQWDVLRTIDLKEPDKVAEHSKLFDVFRPELDVAAITSYPHDHFKTADQVPSDYYSHLLDHVSRRDEIMVMEIGWPSSGSSDAQQEAFVKRLPDLFGSLSPRIVTWSLLHDVSGSGLLGALSTTGLLTADGRQKPAFAAFKALGR